MRQQAGRWRLKGPRSGRRGLPPQAWHSPPNPIAPPPPGARSPGARAGRRALPSTSLTFHVRGTGSAKLAHFRRRGLPAVPRDRGSQPFGAAEVVGSNLQGTTERRSRNGARGAPPATGVVPERRRRRRTLPFPVARADATSLRKSEEQPKTNCVPAWGAAQRNFAVSAGCTHVAFWGCRRQGQSVTP